MSDELKTMLTPFFAHHSALIIHHFFHKDRY